MDIVGEHPLQPRNTVTTGKLHDAKPIFFRKRRPVRGGLIIFREHILYYIGMKIAALVDDLFFSSKISATAKQVGSEIVFCRSAQAVPEDVVRICVDLNSTAFDAIIEIQKLKRTHPAPIVAFLSHVQVDLKRGAEEAGADEVISRSEFVHRLPQLVS